LTFLQAQRLAQRQYKVARFCARKTSGALNCPLELFLMFYLY